MVPALPELMPIISKYFDNPTDDLYITAFLHHSQYRSPGADARHGAVLRRQVDLRVCIAPERKAENTRLTEALRLT